MSTASGAIDARPRVRLGLVLGLLGVIAFSLTLPMTRLAVGQLDPWFVAFGRMSIAGAIAAAAIAAGGVRRPARTDVPLVAWSSVGVVIGFPLLSSLAMKHIPANHGAIINGALPFATALLAALVFGERHSRRFWLCAAIGSALVIALRCAAAARTASAMARRRCSARLRSAPSGMSRAGGCRLGSAASR
jgi:drug/metabolite transporter (DMT)-like permease